jgi:hypothetical protein
MTAFVFLLLDIIFFLAFYRRSIHNAYGSMNVLCFGCDFFYRLVVMASNIRFCLKKMLLFVKARKKLSALILVSVFLIINVRTISDRIFIYFTRGIDYPSFELAVLINSVIGIPYAQQPEYQNSHPDIVKYSWDQWFALPSYRETSPVHIVEYPKNLATIPMPSKKDIAYLGSLKFSPIFYLVRFKQPIYRLLCSHFLTCKTLSVSVQEYVLTNKDLFNNIIKIAERPCDYIRPLDTVEYMTEEEKITYGINYEFRGEVFRPEKFTNENVINDIKWARKRLDCDSRCSLPTVPSLNHPSFYPRRFVLLVIKKDGIVGFGEEPSINLLIERKDICH